MSLMHSILFRVIQRLRAAILIRKLQMCSHLSDVHEGALPHVYAFIGMGNPIMDASPPLASIMIRTASRHVARYMRPWTRHTFGMPVPLACATTTNVEPHCLIMRHTHHRTNRRREGATDSIKPSDRYAGIDAKMKATKYRGGNGENALTGIDSRQRPNTRYGASLNDRATCISISKGMLCVLTTIAMLAIRRCGHEELGIMLMMTTIGCIVVGCGLLVMAGLCGCQVSIGCARACMVMRSVGKQGIIVIGREITPDDSDSKLKTCHMPTQSHAEIRSMRSYEECIYARLHCEGKESTFYRRGGVILIHHDNRRYRNHGTRYKCQYRAPRC